MKTTRQITHDYFFQLIIFLAEFAESAMKHDEEKQIVVIIQINKLCVGALKELGTKRD